MSHMEDTSHIVPLYMTLHDADAYLFSDTQYETNSRNTKPISQPKAQQKYFLHFAFVQDFEKLCVFLFVCVYSVTRPTKF